MPAIVQLIDNKQNVKSDEVELMVEIPGQTLGYRATETRVVHQAEVGGLANRGREGLTLITCYPFDALIPGGPLRFVVFAKSR